MKPVMLVFSFLIMAGVATAQSGLRTDVMGPHANFGRGCSACHAPHNAGIRAEDARLSNAPLWGDGGTSTYGAGLRTYLTAKTPERNGILICLSCHDGNYASKATMKDRIYETLPESYGNYSSIPTLTERPSALFGPDFAEHPVGLDTQIGCGGAGEWDCTMEKGVMVMDGPNSARFASNYGFFNKPHPYEGKEVVVCTTCHNPHSQNLIIVTKQTESRAFRPGVYATNSFLRVPYSPDSASMMSNLSAQYCRQCHADMSNEMNGSTSGTVM